MGYNPAVVTFASPKVFSPSLAKWVNTAFNDDQYLSDLTANSVSNITSGTFSRVTHVGDVVPCVPLAIMGYYHSGVDFYITKDDLPQTISDVEVNGEFKVTDELKTIASDLLELIKDPATFLKDNVVKAGHLEYFYNISTCNKTKK
ncbi:unnamed protein product [Ambrosiozyma monospora]|uniref:Unnamed protein product n=1 Tax=Ambrosiozyma monospora TaxID=43982 RepID=A0ACB5U7Q3_AMBMO|nr:unnamed protein product [Ambrosiozyma monospora]